MLYLLFLIWPFVSIALFFFINKRWGKKNHIALSIFYAITLLIPFPLEKLVDKIVRAKYAKRTPILLEKLVKKGLKFHLVFGTLLFAIRNNNFADNDIDICLFRKDWNKKQEQILLGEGFVKNESWSLDGKEREINYVNKKHSLSLDVFLIDSSGDFAPTFDETNNRYARRATKYKYSVKEATIAGIKLSIPSNPEKYLDWNYGQWRKKDPNYNWFTGSSYAPSVVVKNANIEYRKW